MKDWNGFILCLLLSAGIWLVYNLSVNYTQVVNITIRVESDIEGRSRSSVNPVSIAAKCNARGYRLLGIGKGGDVVTVFINSEDLHHVKDELYAISARSLMKYSENIFGNDVKVESILHEYCTVRFAQENNIKVPVKADTRISFRSQYMATDEVRLKPDSVTLYGSPEVLKGISSVSTGKIIRRNLHGDVHGTVKLNIPVSVRSSSDKVDYDIAVSRFVQTTSKCRVTAVNVPEGSSLLILPGSVTVTLLCRFPVHGNPFDNSEFHVDYKEYENSLSGKCRVNCSGLPESVISYTVEPEFCECIETL